jgi:threonine synthase
MIVGYRCAACGYLVDIATPWAWRCPNSSLHDRHHVLRLMGVHRRPDIATHPLLIGDANLAWLSFARSHNMPDTASERLVTSLDTAVRSVDGVGFHVTPYGRADRLSEALGFDPAGGVFVKDETGNVGGSHKARHLASILLHLLVAEALRIAPERHRPRLAIASCGNAAIAAATLAAAAEWPISVFVPIAADPVVLEHLTRLGAKLVLCERSVGDPAGDPCMHQFRVAVDDGAIPFTVQGPENGLCLDGGRSVAWEMAAQSADQPLHRIMAQVGGGALATCVGDGYRGGPAPALTAVQTEACAPFDRAWQTAQRIGLTDVGFDWATCMYPWQPSGAPTGAPTSLATGILDDETYDWVGLVEGLAWTKGESVVVSDSDIALANSLARANTASVVDHTGTAGLAGLIALRPLLDATDRVGVIFSGLDRHAALG